MKVRMTHIFIDRTVWTGQTGPKSEEGGMFYVWDFDPGAEVFECVGAFSNELEAKALMEARREAWFAAGHVETEFVKCHCRYSEMSWTFFRAQLVAMHLGVLADGLAKLTGDPLLRVLTTEPMLRSVDMKPSDCGYRAIGELEFPEYGPAIGPGSAPPE
jgi:hypothetical protein